MCNDTACKLLLEMGSYQDFNTVQAVYSLGAAIEATIYQLCTNSSTTAIDDSCLNRYTRLVWQHVNITSFSVMHCDYRKILFGFKSIHQVNFSSRRPKSSSVRCCHWACISHCLEDLLCLHFNGQIFQGNEGTTDLHSIRNDWLYSTLSHPRKLKSLLTLLWEPQMVFFLIIIITFY